MGNDDCVFAATIAGCNRGITHGCSSLCGLFKNQHAKDIGTHGTFYVDVVSNNKDGDAESNRKY